MLLIMKAMMPEQQLKDIIKWLMLYRLLKQKKIDCVIIDEQPALSVTKDNDDLKILDEEFTNEDYAICIAKGNDDLKEKINSALKELKGDGTIDEIISNYIGNNAGKKSLPHSCRDDV